jgi:HisJ family histidinol phosphate phosphatase
MTRPPKDPRTAAIPDIHGHAKGEHKPYVEERPIPYSARMLFLWFYHAARRGRPRFMMVADHINYLTFEDPAAVNLVRRALKLAAAGDLYGAAETAGVDLGHAAVVSEGLRRGMRYSIGAEVDNDPRARPDAQNIVEAMKPDGLIRSVHFLQIEHPVHGAGWQWAFDNPEFSSLYEMVGANRVWEIYMATLLEAIEKLPGHIVGHFYVPAKFGHWPDDEKLSGYEDQLVAACRDRGLAIELNTRFYYRYIEDEEGRQRYLDANLRLLRKAKAGGVGIAVGSDAHSPKDQGEGFDHVLELLDAAEINELVFPIAGRLARVALRAIREAPPEPEPEPERPLEAVVTAGESIPGATGERPEVPVTVKPSRPARPRAPRPTKPPARPELEPVAQSAERSERQASDRKEPPRKEPPRTEAPRTEAPRKEPPRKETPRKETPRKETPHKETPHKETPHKEIPHKERLRKETPRAETPRKQTARKEPVRKAPVRKPATHKTKPSAGTKARDGAAGRKLASSAAARKAKSGTKAAKKPLKPVRATPKAKAKKQAAKPPVKRVKRPAAKTRPPKAAPRKTTAKKRPTKARR